MQIAKLSNGEIRSVTLPGKGLSCGKAVQQVIESALIHPAITFRNSQINPQKYFMMHHYSSKKAYLWL